MTKIFISYRRKSEFIARSLWQKLLDHFDADDVFFDEESIPPAVKWETYLRDAVSKTQFMAVVIDPHWLTETDDNTGQPRIQNKDDWVRYEVSQALSRDIQVAPLLFGRASMPSTSQLPEDLKSLRDWQAVDQITNDKLDQTVSRLISSYKRSQSSPHMTTTRPSILGRKAIGDQIRPYLLRWEQIWLRGRLVEPSVPNSTEQLAGIAQVQKIEEIEFVELDAFTKMKRQVRNNDRYSTRPKPVLSVLLEESDCAITQLVGPAGAGKTTTLSRIALMASLDYRRQNFQDVLSSHYLDIFKRGGSYRGILRIPIALTGAECLAAIGGHPELRENAILEAAAAKISDSLGSHDILQYIEKTEQRFLFLIDGLDEVSSAEDAKAILNAAQLLCAQHVDAGSFKFVFGTRDGFLNYSASDRVVHLQPPTKEMARRIALAALPEASSVENHGGRPLAEVDEWLSKRRGEGNVYGTPLNTPLIIAMIAHQASAGSLSDDLTEYSILASFVDRVTTDNTGAQITRQALRKLARCRFIEKDAPTLASFRRIVRNILEEAGLPRDPNSVGDILGRGFRTNLIFKQANSQIEFAPVLVGHFLALEELSLRSELTIDQIEKIASSKRRDLFRMAAQSLEFDGNICALDALPSKLESKICSIPQEAGDLVCALLDVSKLIPKAAEKRRISTFAKNTFQEHRLVWDLDDRRDAISALLSDGIDIELIAPGCNDYIAIDTSEESSIDSFEMAASSVRVSDFQEFIADRRSLAEHHWRHAKPGSERRRISDIPDSEIWEEQKFSLDVPISYISWFEAVAYANWLTETRGDGYRYTLPLETEWRWVEDLLIQQNSERYPWLPLLERLVARMGDEWMNVNDIRSPTRATGSIVDAPEHPCNWLLASSRGKTPPGLFEPLICNGRPIYDFRSNVYEWSRSKYEATDGIYVVGACYSSMGWEMRPSKPFGCLDPAERSDTLGFRLVRRRIVEGE